MVFCNASHKHQVQQPREIQVNGQSLILRYTKALAMNAFYKTSSTQQLLAAATNRPTLLPN
jgi:hypothetical protein